MSCILCGTSEETTYEFQSSKTVFSETAIKSICEEILGVTLDIDEEIDNVICENCLNDVNEVDSMEVKIQNISRNLRERFKNKIKVNADSDSKHMHLEEQEEFEQNTESCERTTFFIKNEPDNDTEDVTMNYEESDDSKDSSYRPSSTEEEIYLNFQDGNTINFTSAEDLNNILQRKEAGDSEDDDDEETNVSVLYDMMDENNIEIVVEKKKEKMQCKKCSQNFETQKELKEHYQKQCKDDSPYICEICGKFYRNKSGLDVHVGMHMGINPFNCVFCKKSFTQKGALIRHVKIHTGEKPYQCEQCGKCFTHHTSFGIHKLSHSGEKSYKCELCGLALISTSHLKRHMRVHTGEKRYACSTCGRKFAERYNLASHQRVHQNGKNRGGAKTEKFKAEDSENSQMNDTSDA